MSGLAWFVAHTRPRREKRLKQYCESKGITVKLPCYRVAHQYRGKIVVFFRPLFPGYVFVELLPQQRYLVVQNDSVARLLVVDDQALLIQQVGEILKLLETEMEVFLAPAIGVGCRVNVKSGPLRNIEGWVEQRYGMTTVLLRLDFIGQAAAVKVQAHELEVC